MLLFLRKIFSAPRPNLPDPVTDSVLKELKFSEDTDCWEGSVTSGGRAIRFKICGQNEPDQKLMAHAHDIVRSLSAFEESVATFLQNELHSTTHLGQFANEIQQLTIEEICLFWPDRPEDGMIFFQGPDEFRVWRCDYIARKPRGLGFDS